jgi:hypothetical protein
MRRPLEMATRILPEFRRRAGAFDALMRLAIRWRCQVPRGFTTRSDPYSSLNDCVEQHDDRFG